MNTHRFYLHDPLLLILSTTILSALFVCHGSNPDAARITENFIADFSGISPAQLCLMLHLRAGEQPCSTLNPRFFLWTRVVQTTHVLLSASAPPSLGTVVSTCSKSRGRDLSDHPTTPDGRVLSRRECMQRRGCVPPCLPKKYYQRWQVLDL